MDKIADFKNYCVLLMAQYQDADRLKGVICTSLDEGNELQDALFEIRDEYWLDTAVGVQLDVIGAIQDIRRNGLNDDDYREAIRTKIAINQGSGEPETVIRAIKQLFGATFVVLTQPGNANLQIYSDVIIDFDRYKMIERIIPAGVSVIAIIYSDGTPFGFQTDPNALGFGALIDAELELSSGDILELGSGDILELINNTSDDSIVDAGEFVSITYGG